MDYIFSTIHSKQETTTSNFMNIIKSDLNLLRIKQYKINLNFISKFYLSCKYALSYLENLNNFCNIEEDAIEKWYQIQIRYYTTWLLENSKNS